MIVTRSKVAFIVILCLMALLCVRFAYLQLFDPEDYRTRALEQYTSSVPIPAKRGSIFASDGTTELAVSATVYNCFISPHDIKDDAELGVIADGLASILGVDRYEILAKGAKKSSKYQVIKKYLTDAEETAVRSFIKDHSESKFNEKIHLEETTKRYYRYGTLAAQLIGFTGSDNTGLTGIEFTYNEQLAGIDGKSLKAQDAYGNELAAEFSTFVPASDGLSVVTTIDWTVQTIVEKYAKQAYEEHNPNGRVECVVMDVTNGEILASAIYPSFDLNNYNELSAYYREKYEVFVGTEEERSKYKSELLYEMWNNTVATQTYEPGSTFKIITSAIALEEGNISYDSSHFSCDGRYKIGSTVIHCHKRGGHGGQSFTEAIVNSCNPAFIQIGLAVGSRNFKTYFEEFGYTKVSGSDITGEVSSIYYGTTNSQFETLELAIYSFGQTFKVTPIQHLRAVSAIANGGYITVPHVVKALVDKDGNTVKTYQYSNDRQVVSADTCNKILKSLTNSTKNACVNGYNVVSKTGTSEKRDTAREDDYISSCVTFAPAEDPRIAVLVLVDEPTAGQHFGSAVAAPVVANILSEVLPHMGITPATQDNNITAVDDYRGMTVEDAKAELDALGLKYSVRGDGNAVLEQMPKSGTEVYKDGVVILYTGDATVQANVKVPDVMGDSPSNAIKSIINSNLNVRISGIFNDDWRNCYVVSQSIGAGEYVAPGTVIELEFLYEEAIE